MNEKLLFMVEFILPQHLEGKLVERLARQRSIADELFNDDFLISYSLSIERKRVWLMLSAVSETEMKQIIDMFPISAELEYDYCLVDFHITKPFELPEFSLN